MAKTLGDLLKEQLHGTLDKYMEGGGRRSGLESANKSADDGEDELSICRYLKGVSFGIWTNAEKEKEAFEEASKAMTELTGAGGGVLVPPKIERQLIPLLAAKSVIRGMGPRVLNLPQTNAVSIPRKTASTTAYWVGESSSITESQPTLGDIQLRLKTVAALCKLPNELLEDSQPSADALVKEDMTDVLARAEDLAIIQGSGGTEPLGLYNDPSVSSTSLTAAITYDDLMDVMYAIEVANATYSGWLMHPRSKNTLRKVKNGIGDLVWQQGDVTKSNPDRLLGLPCFYTTQIPINLTVGAITSSSYIMLGDFKELLIAQKRAGLTIAASSETSDAFAKNQTWFRALRRLDAGPRQPDAFHILKGVQ